MISSILKHKSTLKRHIVKDRVLLVTPEWPPAYCGIADFAKNFRRALIGQGLFVKKVVLKAKGDLPKIESILKDKKCTILHIIVNRDHIYDSSYSRLINLSKAKFSETLIVLTYITSSERPKKNLLRALLLADGVITFGPSDIIFPRSALTTDLSCGASVESQDFNSEGFAPNKEADTFKVVYFGFLNRNKGLGTLINAVKKIPKKYRISFRILGSLHQRHQNQKNNTLIEYAMVLRKKIETLKDDRVIFSVRFRKPRSLARELANSDCCLLPFRDGLSNRHSSFFSALSFGLPVIGTTTKETPKSFCSIPGVVLISGNNASALKNALVSVYKKHLSNSLANKKEIKSYYSKVYSWNILARETICFYKKTKQHRDCSRCQEKD